MDTIEVDVARKEAGRAYLKALRSFGLDPEGLFWALDRIDDQMILMLVTRFFDNPGPLAVTKVLFKAYNAAITPGEIDPFIVRVHSPHHNMIKTMHEGLVQFQRQVIETGKVVDPSKGVFWSPSIGIPMDDVYVWKRAPGPSLDLARLWGRIEQRVEALAA